MNLNAARAYLYDNYQEHYLDLRTFPDDIKLAVWERQHHRGQLPDALPSLQPHQGDLVMRREVLSSHRC